MELCISSSPPVAVAHYSRSLPLNNNSRFSGFSCGRRIVRPLRVTAEGEGRQPLQEVLNSLSIELGKGSAVYNDSTPPQPSPSSDDDESSSDESAQPFQDILNSLTIKVDSDDSYLLLLYGGGSLVAVWLLTAIVGAIDALPVLPKVMEVVGLGYSLWFTTRYLLFKKNRKELSAKIEELKREVLGSDDD